MLTPKKTRVLWGLLVVLTPAVIYAANLSIPNSFNPGESISSAQMNANFAAVQTAVNSKQDSTVVTCGVNSAVTSIASNGTTTCGPARTTTSSSAAPTKWRRHPRPPQTR